MEVIKITIIILRLNQCYHHQQHHDQDYDDNHHQLEWDVCEQCEAEQSRSRERINGGFYWRYPQVIMMMMCMLTVNDDDYDHFDCDR